MDTRQELDIKTPNEPAGPSAPGRPPPRSVLDALRRVQRPFLVAHVTPDADALGAVLALAGTLRGQGVNAVAGLTKKRVAKKLRFMFKLAPDVPLADTWKPGGDPDAIIVLDTASEKRIDIDPVPDLEGDLPVINLDHHITNPDFGRYNWVDPHAASTCEMIARLIRQLGWHPTPGVASLLYAGIHGDTAGFSLPSTSAATLHQAGDLVQAGADVSHIGELLCRSRRKPEFELLRRAYDHTTISDDGRIAYSFLTYDDIIESKCTADEIDDQVSIPLALKDICIAVLFSEGEPGVVRVNLRGEGETSVVEIAQCFGGGGHRQSAGVRLRDRTMPEAIREVLAAAESHLDAQSEG
jgi:phosphoesterase RecJ-like protein